ncbi:hypothetical protein BGZ81_001758 [Podila clonocystis]|nr:hypothetical protein BGZ81_001758 [Podila clonocystis]
MSPEDLNEARTELQKILSEMPIQTFEPLVETTRAYCRAFAALCNIACEERLEATGQPTTEEGDRSPEIASAECANPDAKTVLHARAKCECVGLDMTDRVNFALVGGVTSSSTSPASDFSADGFLDGLTALPSIATFVNIIHIAQKVCYYVGFLKVLADDTSNPVPPTPTGGSIVDGVKGWFPGLFGGGCPKPTPILPPLFGGLFPTPSTPTSTTPTPSTPTPSTDDDDDQDESPTSTVSAASPTPTPKKWFFGLFSETDEHGYILEDDVTGPDQQQRLEGTDDGDDPYRLVSHDGRVARIVRAQKRQTEMKRNAQEQGKHDL